MLHGAPDGLRGAGGHAPADSKKTGNCSPWVCSSTLFNGWKAASGGPLLNRQPPPGSVKGNGDEIKSCRATVIKFSLGGRISLLDVHLHLHPATPVSLLPWVVVCTALSHESEEMYHPQNLGTEESNTEIKAKPCMRPVRNSFLKTKTKSFNPADILQKQKHYRMKNKLQVICLALLRVPLTKYSSFWQQLFFTVLVFFWEERHYKKKMVWEDFFLLDFF